MLRVQFVFCCLALLRLRSGIVPMGVMQGSTRCYTKGVSELVSRVL